MFSCKIKHTSKRGTEWTLQILQAIIPSSSVAILIVLLALLTLTRRKKE